MRAKDIDAVCISAFLHDPGLWLINRCYCMG
jgi:hypothetical protein